MVGGYLSKTPRGYASQSILGVKRKTAGSRAGRFQRSSWREPQ